ncbi:unnamed protein product, partial [Effrenium voratum]
RSLVLDYFDSVRRSISEDHVVFSFDQQMTCGEGDTAWVEQMGLCLGLDSARREAACLLTGERPELLELFPEIAWFRDTVFLWKMLLLPACQCPPMQQWRAADSLLKWQYKKGRFEVVGFGMTLTAEAQRPSFFQGVLRWFGQYESDNKSLSRASPSVLAGSQEINTEDDVLFLNQLPTFNGAAAFGPNLVRQLVLRLLMGRCPEEIEYTERYKDDSNLFEYRHVHLTKAAKAKVMRLSDSMRRLLTEEEWRGVGVLQSPGWEHYEWHCPEPHILLFRRRLDTHPSGRAA